MSSENLTLSADQARGFPLSVISAAISAALVGFGGSVALVLQAARAVGANPDQTTSWVVALCIGIAATSFYLSWKHRMPIITAWSTPGAAVVALGAAGIGVNEAIGAFVVAALMVLATAVIRPLGGLIERIPKTVAAAMLAGVLFRFCLEVAATLPVLPYLVLPLVVAFFVVQLWSANLAVPIVLVLGMGIAAVSGLIDETCCQLATSMPTVIIPAFDISAAIGLALPLYIVTMASQNLAGLAVLKADGFGPSVRSCLGSTGLISLLTAPFGGHAVCLSAITASICTGPACHSSPASRWRAGPVYALCYVLFAGFAETLVEFLLALPAALITTFVGLALFGPLVGSLKVALAGDAYATKAAAVTFLVAASGFSVSGIGAAFWSLIAGLFIVFLTSIHKRYSSTPSG